MARGPLAEKNRRRFLRNRQDPRHGTSNGYSNLGCRCKWVPEGHPGHWRGCTGAWADRHLEYMHNNPKQRKLQAERNLKARGVKRQRPYVERPDRWRDIAA